MGLCGYNDKIGEGLRLLFEGMSDALEAKARRRSASDVVSRELTELGEMILVLQTAPDETLPAMFAGLNLFAMALFLKVDDELKQGSRETLAELCAASGENFIALLAETEAENETMPPCDWNEAAIGRRARELGLWALHRSRKHRAEVGAIGCA